MGLSTYFPTLIYEAPLLKDKKSLTKWIREVKKDSLKIFEHDKEGHQWSSANYPNGYTSYSSVANLHEVNSLFRDLTKRIDAHVKSYGKALGFSVKHKLS